MARSDSPRLAVLIDADNTTPAIAESLLVEIAKYGTATVRRAYGDWTTPRLGGWKDANNSHAIQPMQQFSYTTGKNATDSALIIDAMDLLYTGNLDGFCLVSSDSDFTKLASRLRESGMTVYGFGEKKTPKPLVAACDKFVYLDVLRSQRDAEGEPDQEPDEGATAGAPGAVPRQGSTQRRRSTGAELRDDTQLVRLLRDAIDSSSDDDGWAHLGGVGSLVVKQAPDFDSRNWGYAKLVDLVTEIGLFDVERPPGQQVRVREKPKGRSSTAPTKPVVTTRTRGAAKTAKAAKATEETAAPVVKAAEKPPEKTAEKPAVKRTTRTRKRAADPAP
jgi:uncharacterized LabA/DUF88 family protein